MVSSTGIVAPPARVRYAIEKNLRREGRRQSHPGDIQGGRRRQLVRDWKQRAARHRLQKVMLLD
jgi:hypothetical protein